MSTESCPNPLFLQWVTEWYEDAKAHNLQIQHVYKRAQASLQEYPARLETAQETTKLSGIGQKISDKLAKKLTAWRKYQGIPEPVVEGAEGQITSQQTSKQTTRVYIPRYRSGAFALMIGLYKTYRMYGADYYTPKAELVALSGPFTDTPFHSSSNGGFNSMHTAWSGIKTLETKGLVDRQGRVKFAITEDGLEIAEKVVEVLRARNELSEQDKELFRKETADDSILEIDSLDCPAPSEVGNQTLFRTQSTTADIARYHSAGAPRHHSSAGFSRQSSTGVGIESSELIHYPQSAYDVILLVDTREIHSSADRDLIDKELKDKGIKIEIRSLTLGDYLWIARAKSAGPYKHLPDVVLDYVVERKRMDDLCASIRDGRYREQHSRINATNFTNVLYVVEGDDPEAVRRLGEGAVDSAISRVQVREGYHLKRPQTFTDTLRILRQTTGIIRKTLGDRLYAIPDHLVGQREFAKLKSTLKAKFPRYHLGMSFDAYDTVSSKSNNMGVGEIYLRILMTMRGCSANQAIAIGNQYQSPQQLMDALRATLDERKRQKLVADLMMSNGRKVGPVVAKRMVEFWTQSEFI